MKNHLLFICVNFLMILELIKLFIISIKIIPHHFQDSVLMLHPFDSIMILHLQLHSKILDFIIAVVILKIINFSKFIIIESSISYKPQKDCYICCRKNLNPFIRLCMLLKWIHLIDHSPNLTKIDFIKRLPFLFINIVLSYIL